MGFWDDYNANVRIVSHSQSRHNNTNFIPGTDEPERLMRRPEERNELYYTVHVPMEPLMQKDKALKVCRQALQGCSVVAEDEVGQPYIFMAFKEIDLEPKQDKAMEHYTREFLLCAKLQALITEEMKKLTRYSNAFLLTVLVE